MPVPTIPSADYIADLKARADASERVLEEMRLTREAERAKCPRVPLTWSPVPTEGDDSLTITLSLLTPDGTPIPTELRHGPRSSRRDSTGASSLRVARDAFGRDTLLLRALGHYPSFVPLPAPTADRLDVPLCSLPQVLNQVVTANARYGQAETVFDNFAPPPRRLWSDARGVVALRWRVLPLKAQSLPADLRSIVRGVPDGVPVNARVAVSDRVYLPAIDRSRDEAVVIEVWQCGGDLARVDCDVALIDASAPVQARFDGRLLQLWMHRQEPPTEESPRPGWLIEFRRDGGAPSIRTGVIPGRAPELDD